jgi:HPt (histidine-containing phosphotransfer) domain-containing protein
VLPVRNRQASERPETGEDAMSSVEPSNQTQKLISQLLQEDADLRDIVEEFVDGLSGRAAEIEQARQQMDFEQLTTLAHRLKGAAGSYGYPEISQLCAAMEQEFRAHQLDDFTSWMEQLSQMAVAARAGLDTPPA